MKALVPSRATIAFDTLGNGDSDKPTATAMAIGDYAPVVVAALDDQGVDDIDLYGTHTGALIAMELAIALGERVGSVVLEGVTIFDADEVGDILDHYFAPSRRCPTARTSAAWNLYRDVMLWWPWYHRSATASAGSRCRARSTSTARCRAARRAATPIRSPYRAAFTYPTEERLPLVPRARPAVRDAGGHAGGVLRGGRRLAPRGQARSCRARTRQRRADRPLPGRRGRRR